MTSCGCGEPLSDLDSRVDDLLQALARTGDLDELIASLDGFDVLVASLSVDSSWLTHALALSAVWSALADTAREVKALKELS
jgi:hypothetical protein